MRHFLITLAVLSVGSILLACLGLAFPLQLLIHLAGGWVLYLRRVLPQVEVSWSGVLTAAVCLTALALGLHAFLRWIYGAWGPASQADKYLLRPWAAHWTAMILGLIVLLFVAGISVVGISHQTAWLLTSPEPLLGSSSQWRGDRVQQLNTLKQLALAMHESQDAYGSLPPASSWSKEGNPLLSWRVLILPFIEQEKLYKEFHLDEPWDSPHNLRLLPRMPRTFAAPLTNPAPNDYYTHYLAFVGKGAAFEGRKGLRIPRDFPDGTSNTILFVDSAWGVPWTKPEDLPYDPDQPLPALGTLHPDFFQVAMADGSIRFLKKNTLSEQTLRAAITRNGGEQLGPDW